MSSDASDTIEFVRVMDETGFCRNGKPGTGLSMREKLLDPRSPKHFKYKAAIEKLGAAAIFELSDSPCIYFKYLADSRPSDADLTEIHQLAWNHGLAPTLWVVTPSAVRIYNCYSRPQTENPQEHAQHLIRAFSDIADGLQDLTAFAGRLQYETGRFWRTKEAGKIDRRQRVDAALLDDLGAARDDLVASDLPMNVAQALLGWSIFVAYLQDRDILKPQFFRANYAAERLTEVLRSEAKTQALWNWVRVTFNGDLFPLTPAERQLLRQEHLGIVRRLLEGTSRSGQTSLWPYRFDVIPVELISSIYEMFTHSADESEAKGRSTHYTPMNLVDLVLSQVFNKSIPPDGKVADLACGSGVFLVEALRRLVSLRLANGETLTRKLIREVLHDQIFGVDILDGAIRIAAFSLYLTVLELDPDPQPPSALKFRELIGTNLFTEDAFDEKAEFPRKEPFASRGFAAIVGNPPWTRTEPGSSNAVYCEERGYLTATEVTPDQAFLWRVGDFASEDTRIGLILHGKPFFTHARKAPKARNALLQRYCPDLIINLAELRELHLFPTVKAPAVIFIANARGPTPDVSFTFAAARRCEDFRNHGIIEITPDCIHRLPLSLAASDSDMLKVASWGSARDMALVRKVRCRPGFTKLPTLVDGLGWPPSARGFQSGSSHKLPSEFPMRLLEAGKMQRFCFDAETLPERDPQLTVNAGHSRPEIYQGPLLIATRGLQNQHFYSAVTAGDVLYTQLYIGIPAARQCSEGLHLLNGILNASLSTYYLFMTGSSWGVERDTVELMDLNQVPVPGPDLLPDPACSAVAKVAEELARSALAGPPCQELVDELDEQVFRLYGVTDEAERVLVEDTLDITLDLRREKGGSKALRRPTPDAMEAYAKQFISAVEPLLRTRNQRTMAAEVLDVGAAPLAVVLFRMLARPDRRPPVVRTEARGLAPALSAIEERLHVEIADEVFAKRFLRVYGKDELYVIKPAELRYWTRSAALNDADEILAEHLGAERGMQ